MNLQQLEYFLTVAQKLNFTEAAKQHFVTQPAISRQIFDLEQRVGATLVNRANHQISLTLAGETFFQYAQQMLDVAHDMKTRLINVSEGRIGHLRISAVPSSLPELCDYLALFSKRYPNIQVEVDVGTGIEQLECMHKATHDLYFSFYTHVLAQRNLECVPTSENRFALLIHRDEISRVNLADFSSLNDRPLVMEYHATGPFLVDKILNLCSAHERTSDNILACSSFLSVSLLVNANMGFSILPMNMARACYADHIEVFPIPGEDALNLSGIGWHKPLQSRVVMNFLDVVRELSPDSFAPSPF